MSAALPAGRRGRAWSIAKGGVVAAAYAALVYAFPVSHMPSQMRIAETLKPLVIWEPDLIPAFVLGNFLSNIWSPFGIWDWTWMPFANLVGATVAWRLGGLIPWKAGQLNAYLAAAAYAVVTSLALATMFHFVLHAPFHSILLAIAPVELLLIVGGVPLMWPLHTALTRSLKARS